MKAPGDTAGIAIIGMSCRFPGASGLDAFWRNLVGGVESITRLSEEALLAAGVAPHALRDPDYVRAASILDRIETFDAPFFEYSAQEARIMDPQQRLLLEAAWEAFEDAGHVPGGDTGVFVGCGGVVSSYLIDRIRASMELPGYTGSLSHLGNDKDFASTRISYKLNLRGPSINVQTACSTSLVAVHLACQSILSGECDMALAGASAIRVPQREGYASVKGGILSPDGHCRAFDADAAGTVFGSGVGIVLLKDVKRAIEDRDHIYAVIRGSAVNNDGADKISFTASSVPGQARAMVEAMGVAQVDAGEIDYVECHGTGTTIGDPLEIGALTRAFRTATDRQGFCAIGSVKSNFGHLEQCAGMAGLIKTALSLHRQSIPPSLHYRRANPKIDFESSPFFVNTQTREWARNGHARHAGVNSLGLGGTNAFIVLEEAPETAAAPPSPTQPELIVISAKTDTALRASIERHAAFIGANPQTPLAAIGRTMTEGRSHFPVRFATVADRPQQLGAALSKRLSDERETAPPLPRRLAFLFSGQASQYAGMGAELYRTEPVFRETFDRCDAIFKVERGLSLKDVVFDNSAPAALDDTINTQPALFAIQASLADLWKSFGVMPDAVMGHSIGEFAAGVCAGACSLEDGFKLVLKRAALMQALPRGAMASIAADEATVASLLNDLHYRDLVIAGINAPQSTVVSGNDPELVRMLDECAKRNIAAQRLPVSHAFHSPQMKPAIEAFGEFASRVNFSAPAREWVSTLAGKPVTGVGADYWCQQALQPVRYRDAIVALAASGAYDCVEIGPGNALLALGRQSCTDPEMAWLPSLLRDKERRTLLIALGKLYEAGRDIDWAGFHRFSKACRVPLPAYPFEPHRYWLDQPKGAHANAARNASTATLTGTRMRSASDEAIFESLYGLRDLPYLADHIIYGHAVLPLTAGLVALHGAARDCFGETASLAGIQYREAMIVPEEEPAIVQSVLAPAGDRHVDCRLASLAGEKWHTHLVARAEKAADMRPIIPADIKAIRARCAKEIAPDPYYTFAQRLGLEYGPMFRGIASVQLGDGEALTRVTLPADLPLPDTGQHPALLDACLHIYPLLAPDFSSMDAEAVHPPAWLPVSLGRFSMREAPCREVWVHAVRRASDPADRQFSIDLAILDDSGAVVASLRDLTLKLLPEAALIRPPRSGVADWLYRIDWQSVEDRSPVPQGSTPRVSWLILADTGGIAEVLARQLENRGDTCRLIKASEAWDALQSPEPIDALSKRFLTAIEETTRTYLPPLRGIIHLWPLDFGKPVDATAEIEANQRRMIGSAAALFRAMADAPPQRTASARLYLVTRNAVQVSDEAAIEPMAASVWGLGRSAALEHPQSFGGLIDLDAAASPQAAAEALLSQILHHAGEDQVALRGKSRFAARLVRTTQPQGEAQFDPQALYLVTGGLGTVGVELARWLVSRMGVKHLMLVSRRGEDDPRAKTVREALEQLGAKIEIRKTDVASESDMTALFDGIDRSAMPLKGVFHCAGLLDDGILSQMDWDRFARVMNPKVAGGWLLDRLTRKHRLDHFVLFSSVLSLIGSAGQANYAAANTFLDALIDRRRSEGRPALGLNWGPWAGDGLATASGDKGRALWRARGTQYLETEQVWTAFDALIGRSQGHAAVTVTDWPVFLQQFDAAPPLYDVLQQEFTARDRKRKPRSRLDLRKLLQSTPASTHATPVTAFVQDAVNDTLGLSGALDPKRPLREYGLDSLMAITLINQIEAGIGIRIPMSRMIKGPSLEQLVEGVLADLGGIADNAARPAPAIQLADRWLMTIHASTAPTSRLFCFPFAGGGSAVYQNWAPLISSDVELIAVEPPGRLSRIEESPVSDIDDFIDHVIGEMQGRLDLPFAFFGHCLGGLTLYETARRLRNTSPFTPHHLFVSGARPPDRIAEQGDFERALLGDLMKLAEFRINAPTHAQTDSVFSDVIRHFNIIATGQLLEQPELRDLMLPIIRAEFRMANNYVFEREPPFDIPITCFYGKDDTYVTREQALGWGRFTDSRFRAHIRAGAHFGVIDDMHFITETINRELAVDSNSHPPG